MAVLGSQSNHSSNNENSINSYQRVFKALRVMNSLPRDSLHCFTSGWIFKHYPHACWLPPGQPPGHNKKSHLGKSTNQGNKTSVEQPIEFMVGF